MLRFAPIALSVVLVGCRPRATTSPGPERLADGPRPASVAPLPRDLPGYAVIDTTKYDNANLGLSYRYRRSDGFQADVYLYPLPSIGALCGTACAEQQAASIVSGFKETIPMLVERGYWDSVVPLSETAMPVGPRSWLSRGQHLVLRTVRQGQPQDSHLLILVGHETILKIRASYQQGTFAAAVVDTFAAALIARIPAPYSCRLGPSSSPGMSITTTRALAPEAVVGVLDSILVLPAWQLDYRDPDAGLWRTRPRFTPSWSGSEGSAPGVVLFVAAGVKGDSSTVAISAQNA